jgi:cellulose synthase/poly-beta-1,6-N-acetylglucosamine synthase-like glycosyltransferase
MLILLILSWILTIAYVILMLVYRRGWFKQELFRGGIKQDPETKVSIIIPARNEEVNIGKCIKTILANNYPSGLFDILVIDDHSTDRTAEIVASFQNENVKCLSLESYLQNTLQLNSYKKKAIEMGVDYSVGELIITTDADCEVSSNWLSTIVSYYENEDPVMIAGPVAFNNKGGVLQSFQSIDFMSMQGITAAANAMDIGSMSNGANLAFTRAAFHAVNGYEGIDHLASGDDLLLMMKMKKTFPGKVKYLFSVDAIVRTSAQESWKGFFNQRIRWASKSGKYDDKKLTFVLVVVYLFNLLFPVLFFAGFFDSTFWLLGAGILFLKIALELYFLLPVSEFYNKSKELRWFPFLQPLHIIYIVIAGFLGFIGVYSWKGRRVK